MVWKKSGLAALHTTGGPAERFSDAFPTMLKVRTLYHPLKGRKVTVPTEPTPGRP
jgi:hypothetical protein